MLMMFRSMRVVYSTWLNVVVKEEDVSNIKDSTVARVLRMAAAQNSLGALVT